MHSKSATDTNDGTIAFDTTWKAVVASGALLLLAAGFAHAGTWESHGPIGGNGMAVAVAPSEPTTIYAGTNGGGIFKSTDGGAVWSAVNGGISNPGDWNVEALVLDPTTPDRAYAAVSSGTSGGVFRTTNGGASWTLSSFGFATDVAIDPATPQNLWAAGAAVYKSTDSGATWTPLLAGITFHSVAVDPSAPSTVYAGTIFGTIYKTTNAGTDWTPLNGLPGDHVDAIGVDPTNSSIVYAGLEDFGVYKTFNGGMDWTPFGPTVGSQAVSVQDLAIDPTDTGTVYVGGFVSGPGSSVGVYRSTNGGETWHETPLIALVRSLALDPANPSNLIAATQDGLGLWRTSDGGDSWDVSNQGLVNTNIGALATAPTLADRVYAGAANRGVFRSDDGGVTWEETAFPGVLEVFFSVAVDPTAAGTVYVGTHFDAVYKTSDGGDHWSQLATGSFPLLIGAIVVDPSTPDVVYAGGFGGVARSTTGGGNWAFVNNGLHPIVAALAIDPSAPSTLYAGTVPGQGSFSGVYKTTNGGGAWSPMNTGLPAIPDMSAQSLAIDPAAPSTVYVGFDRGGGVYKTIDGAASWVAAGDGLPGSDIESLAVDPVVPGTVYAGTAREGVFVSTNGGTSWVPMSFGLHNPFVRALAVAAGRLYAGTAANGAFVTDTATSPPAAILGKSIVIQNPNPSDPARRKLTVVASEPASTVTLDLAALLANGGILTVTAEGPLQLSSQSFSLPGPWIALGTTGARYSDRMGINGPVRSVDISKTSAGTMKVKIKLLGKLGPGEQPHLKVVPPNPGTEAQVSLQVNGGGAYCTGFGDAAGGSVQNKGPLLFRVTNPTVAACD
jgi:photosystem II stability/assembly factor-like uncharacterized protein